MSTSRIKLAAIGGAALFFLFTVLATISLVSAASNAIVNPSFTTGTGNAATGWANFSFGVNNAAATIVTGRTGASDRAAQVSVTSYTDGDAKWGQADAIPVNPGEFYTFSDWYKSTVGTEIDIFFTTSGGEVFQWLADVPASADWSKLPDKTFLIPAGATGLRITHTLVGVGTLATDDYSLVKSDASPIFSQGLVTLTFDDGWQSFQTNARPILDGKGFKATNYIITGADGSNVTTNTPNGGYMSRATLLNLQTAGYDIEAHTRSHLDLVNTDWAAEGYASQTAFWDNEVLGSRNALLGAGFSPVDSFAYPYGQYNTALENYIASKGFLGARSVDQGYNFTNSDLYGLKMQHITNNTTAADVQGWIDTALANKTWLVIMFHNVRAGAETTGAANAQCIEDVVDANGDPVVPAQTQPDVDCTTTGVLQTVANYLATKPVGTVKTMHEVLQLLGNQPPSFTSVAPTSVAANSAYTYNITATDLNASDTLAITATGLPAWLTLTDHGNRTATLSGTPGDADVGSPSITLHVSDGALSADQPFTLTVSPDVPPTLAQVTPVPTPTNDTTPSYTFSSSEAGTITYGGSCTSLTVAVSAGNNTVTFDTLIEGTYSDCTITVTDAHAHASTPLAVAPFTIDTTKPIITLTLGSAPYDTATVSLHTGDSYTELGATALDTPSTDLTASIVTTGTVSTALPGTNVVHYNVSDAAGNAADEVLRTINVSDASAPVFGAIPDVTVEATDASGAVVNYTPPSATDAVDGAIAGVCAPAPSSLFPVGTTVLSCTATDLAGNVGVGSFSIKVEDQSAPTITLPADQTFEATGALTTPTLVPATAVDTVDPSPVVTYTPHSFPVGASQVVTWTATDATAHASNAVSHVTITDTTAPTIALEGDAVVSVPLGGTYTELGATASDIVDGDFAATPSGAVDTATEGVYTVTYTATDAAGNAATSVTRDVVVSDLTFSDEQSASVSQTSVTISWTTTNPGTSRVLWDTTSHDPLTDTTAPNYGYANSTDEDSATSTSHSVTVGSLAPGTTYYFRPVSHGSPDTLGSEVSATTQTPPPPPAPATPSVGVGSNGPIFGGGGGFGGFFNFGGSVLGASTTNLPQQNVPQVAGASCYAFTTTLRQGMSGADVVELQKILIAGGYLSIAAPTGYFGPMTSAAVSAYQKSNGIDQVGVVGPKTRAALNACAQGSDTSAQIKSLQALVEKLKLQIQQLLTGSK